jgi:hypothetical protein
MPLYMLLIIKLKSIIKILHNNNIVEEMKLFVNTETYYISMYKYVKNYYFLLKFTVLVVFTARYNNYYHLPKHWSAFSSVVSKTMIFSPSFSFFRIRGCFICRLVGKFWNRYHVGRTYFSFC